MENQNLIQKQMIKNKKKKVIRKKKSPSAQARTKRFVQNGVNLDERLKKKNAMVLFAVYNCRSGENKIIKALESYQDAEDYCIDNCDIYPTGLQIRKVFKSRNKPSN